MQNYIITLYCIIYLQYDTYMRMPIFRTPLILSRPALLFWHQLKLIYISHVNSIQNKIKCYQHTLISRKTRIVQTLARIVQEENKRSTIIFHVQTHSSNSIIILPNKGPFTMLASFFIWRLTFCGWNQLLTTPYKTTHIFCFKKQAMRPPSRNVENLNAEFDNCLPQCHPAEAVKINLLNTYTFW